MKKNILTLLIIILLSLVLSGCSTADFRVGGNISLDKYELGSSDSTTMKVNLEYNDFGVLSDDLNEYRISVFTNGDHLSIYKDNNRITKNNAELVNLGKEQINTTIEYEVRSDYISSGKYVESITIYIADSNGIFKTITSDFITISRE